MSVEHVPLRYVTSLLARGTAPNYADDGPVRIVSQAANQDSGLDWGRTRFHEATGDPRKLKGHLEFGDSLVNSTGTGTLGRIGWFEKAPDNRPCVADGHVTVARFAPSRVDKRFGYYYLKSDEFQDFMFETLVNGSTNQIELSRERMSAVSMPVPPLEEQRRIADFLDAETTRVDKLMTAKQRVVELIDERRISLSSEFCLRGADPDSKLRDSGIGPLGSIPKHWSIMRNKNLLVEMDQRSEDGEEELLSVSHITGVTPRSEKKVYMFMADSLVGYKTCSPGDLVVNTLWAWMGALGVSGRNGMVSPAYGVYRFISEEALPEYFDLLYRTPEYVCEMTRFSKGVWTSRLRLYPEVFLSLKVPLPPVDEQRAIVERVRSEIEPSEHLKYTILKSNELLAERRQALITAVVTGQIDVSTASGRGIEE